MSSLVLRRQGNLADISGDMPETLVRDLENQLSYNHVSQVRTPGNFRQTGSSFSSELVKLFTRDDHGRIVFSRGFSSRVVGVCKSHGFDVTVTDVGQTHRPADRFEADFHKVFMRMELKAKQDECLALVSIHEGGIIVAPTGFGKSFLFAAVCLMFSKARIHVVTRRRDVMKRLIRHLSKFIPDVGQVGGGSRTWSRVTVITADSLHLVEHTQDTAADVVLYDEVHEAAAPSYSMELAKYQNARMFGFTATPEGRFDGAHYRLEGLFGPRIFEMTYPEAVAHGLVLPVRVNWIDVRMDKNPAEFKRDVYKERAGIWRNNYRNELIASKAREFDDDDQVLILVRTLEHAIFLKQELPEFKLCYDKMDSDFYDGLVKKGLLDKMTEPAMTSQIRDKMSKDFEAGTLKKVIATDVWSTGVDFPQLSVLIRADARASEIMDIQAPGRVVRRHDESGKEYGMVIDCMDYFDVSFLRRSQERKKTYIRQGWEAQAKRARGAL